MRHSRKAPPADASIVRPRVTDLHGISIVVPVYRDATRAIAAVAALAALPTPDGAPAEIIVVDDGSSDHTATRIADRCAGLATLVALPANVGRTAARNAGARAARGATVVFVDCDCLPATDALLVAHARTLAGGACASVGPVHGTGSGFWHAFQVRSSQRRERLMRSGAPYAGSTQNLAVRADAFRAIGGFDERYAGYGFEDRDLLVRLGAHGPVAWTAGALVLHCDELALPAICAKMREAGERNAVVFSREHPEAYRRLGYRALDCAFHPVLRIPARLFGPLLPALARVVDPLLERRWLPFALRAALASGLSAASYCSGTARPSTLAAPPA